MGNDLKYHEKISSICKKHEVNLILPTSDEEAFSLSKNRSFIENDNTILACTDFETIKIFNDKILTYKKLEEYNIPCPVYKISQNKDDISNIIDELITKFDEIIVKPSNTRGGRDVYIISNKIKGYKENNSHKRK